jgi:hypothetical protein
MLMLSHQPMEDRVGARRRPVAGEGCAPMEDFTGKRQRHRLAMVAEPAHYAGRIGSVRRQPKVGRPDLPLTAEQLIDIANVSELTPFP